MIIILTLLLVLYLHFEGFLTEMSNLSCCVGSLSFGPPISLRLPNWHYSLFC